MYSVWLCISQSIVRCPKGMKGAKHYIDFVRATTNEATLMLISATLVTWYKVSGFNTFIILICVH